MQENINALEIKCGKCGHERNYRGKHLEKINEGATYPIYVPCSICRKNINLQSFKKKGGHGRRVKIR